MKRIVFSVLIAIGMIEACASNDDDGGAAGLDDASTAQDTALAFDTSPANDAGADTNVSDGAEPCSPDNWCYTRMPTDDIADAAAVDPNFVPVELEDVWPMPDHGAWAVSNEGYVLHFTQGAWKFITTTNSPLSSVWAASNDDVWIAGAGAYVAHGTTQGGVMTFAKVDLADSTDDVLRVRGKATGDVLAITQNDIFHSTNATFTRVAFPNGIARDGTQEIKDMWGSGDSLWIGAHEFSTCGQFDDGCNYADRTVLLHYVTTTSFDRIPLDLVCGKTLCKLSYGATSPTGTHFLHVAQNGFVGGGGNLGPRVAHVTARDAGILDAAAAQGDGGYIWELDDPACNTPTGIWAAADDNAWSIGDSPAVRHWDGHQLPWTLSRIAVTAPVTNVLHATSGVLCTDNTREVWIVGQNIAMHRTEKP